MSMILNEGDVQPGGDPGSAVAPNAATGGGGMTGNDFAAGAYGVSAGLDLMSGVLNFLSAGAAASAARSRGDLMRIEAEANAQRYEEQAQQFEAKEKVMYLSSGVKLSGSPVDALATTARVAQQNVVAIAAQGDQQAMGENVTAVNDEIQGRNALVSGMSKATNQGVNMAILAGSFGSSGGGS